MKKAFKLVLLIILFFNSGLTTFAVNDPLSVANNVFGIHINNEKDFPEAVKLINSSGGDWGYVTFVITQEERSIERWQGVFDQMRRLHIIPIVRIATKAFGDTWEIPNQEEIDTWVTFLNSLNWVIQNRYVVALNEPNHALEWGNKVDPEEYAQYLSRFALALHSASSDFFVLPAGFDATAQNTSNTMDESIFLKKMLIAVPDLFDYLDGWTSHSYPNPDFSGKETDMGRSSIGTFKWELDYLKTLGVTKDLPVFITETGWSNQKVEPEEIGNMYEYAFKNVWNDPKIVAVTPFILNYPQPPFTEFSWKDSGGNFYPYYPKVESIKKICGSPIQIISGKILAAFAQPIIPYGSDYPGIILAKNTGQTIWNSDDVFVKGGTDDVDIKSFSFSEIEPNRLNLIVFKSTASNSIGIYSKSVKLESSDGKDITNSFPIEALIVKIGKPQITSFIEKITRFFGF